VLITFIEAIAQDKYKLGDTIEFVLDGYKEGKIQWQFSKDKNKWIDLKNENNIKLTTLVNGPGFFRAGVTTCINTLTSDLTYIDSPLNDYDYIDSIGRYLASDELGGRAPGTHGDTLAVNFINNCFESIGLVPLNGNSFIKRFKMAYSNIPTFNIIGTIPGNDSLLKKEIIVISAHYDHLGTKSEGIYNGADDNASGIAGICLLARKLKESVAASKRTFIIIACGAEEYNPYLQGMKEFVNSKDVDIKDIKYVFNYEMIGRLNDKMLYYYGKNYSSDLISTFDSIDNHNFNIQYSTNDLFGRSGSDHLVFTKYNIPTFSTTTGWQPDYHKITDDWEYININGILNITSLSYKIIDFLADRK
jgi:hypothetical protein